MSRKQHRAIGVLVKIFLFVIVFAGVFLGIQFFTKTGLFKIPGVVHYDESLTENEVGLLKTILTDETELDKDVIISARNELFKPELHENEFLVAIYVPVTDFYTSHFVL